jgi:hypothetical protein
MDNRRFYIALVIMAMMAVVSCAQRSPERTVRDYLQMLSGERVVTESSLRAVTTEHYRTTEHPHLASLAAETRESAIDLAEELRDDPAIREFMQHVSWRTTYETTGVTDTGANVVARVIIAEKRPGDRDAALGIEGLPQALKDVLERGTELPFRFTLVNEGGQWKIDEFEIPDALREMID